MLLTGRLRYLKGRKGAGRALTASVPALGLLAGDRLEPTASMPDVALFDSAPVPFEAVFWRATRDPRGACLDTVVRRNPVFSAFLGISPMRTLAIDSLHTLYYGPVMRWTAAVLWRLLLGNPWGFVGNQDARLELGCRRLRSDLQDWCTRTGVPPRDRLNDWTLAMMGSDEGCLADPGTPHPGTLLKTKAAETGLVMRWALDILRSSPEAQGVPFRGELLQAGAALERFMDLTTAGGRVLSTGERQALMDCAQAHLVYCERAQVHYVPKHHMFMHLAHRRPPLQDTIKQSFVPTLAYSCRVVWLVPSRPSGLLACWPSGLVGLGLLALWPSRRAGFGLAFWPLWPRLPWAFGLLGFSLSGFCSSGLLSFWPSSLPPWPLAGSSPGLCCTAIRSSTRPSWTRALTWF